MTRIMATVTKEMHAALEKHASLSGIPMSVVIRKSIEQYLKTQGYELREKIVWGGNHKAGVSDEPT